MVWLVCISGRCRGFFMSGFDIAYEVVVDFDIPDSAAVLDFLFSDVDALDKPQEGGAVKFL